MQAFWSERVAWVKMGRRVGHATIVFGMRSASHYSKYLDELEHAIAVGAVDNVFLSLSQSHASKKFYVQAWPKP